MEVHASEGAAGDVVCAGMGGNAIEQEIRREGRREVERRCAQWE